MRHALLLVVLAPSLALAFNRDGGAFDDGFETGTLRWSDVPSGEWESMTVSEPGNAIFLALEDAAHRGRFGARMIDDGGSATWSTTLTVTGRTYASATWARFWVRLRDPIPQSAIWLLANLGPLSVYVGSDSLAVAGGDSDGMFRSGASDAGLVVGRWHLMETSIEGLGTDAGRRSLWVDGVPFASTQNNDLRLDTVDQFKLGMPHAQNRLFWGAVDFDDVRVDVAPLAERLHVVLPSAGLVGECLPGSVSMRDVTGALRTPGHAVSVRLTGALTCDGGALAADQTGTQVAVRFLQAGVFPVVAEDVEGDFLPSPRVVVTIAAMDAGAPDAAVVDAGLVDSGTPDAEPETDAGTPPVDAGTPHAPVLNVGCGCESSALGAAWSLLLPTWLRRRRR